MMTNEEQRMLAALAELVQLKAIKDRFTDVRGRWTSKTAREDYVGRKPAAWAEAKSLVARLSKELR